ncbi:MAG: 50S ribosomal protein L18 [bacterium]
MSEKSVAIVRRKRRQLRTRKAVHGTAERPRLAVFRSSKHIYAQLVDDDRGVTLAAAGSTEPDVRKNVAYGGNKAAASVIGKLLGERAKEKGITSACFDRRGYRYHGRVAALADAAREAGLQF